MAAVENQYPAEIFVSAARNGDLDLIRYLVETRGISPLPFVTTEEYGVGLRREHKTTHSELLVVAIQAGHAQVAEYFLGLPQIDPNACSTIILQFCFQCAGFSTSALGTAVEKKDVKTLRLLLVHPKTDVHLLYGHVKGVTPSLHSVMGEVIERNDAEMAEILLASGRVDLAAVCFKSFILQMGGMGGTPEMRITELNPNQYVEFLDRKHGRQDYGQMLALLGTAWPQSLPKAVDGLAVDNRAITDRPVPAKPELPLTIERQTPHTRIIGKGG